MALSDQFGRGSIGEQLLVWSVLGQVIGALVSPGVLELGYLVNEAATNVELSPAELAALVNRGFIEPGSAAAAAAKYGINASRFSQLVDLAGNAPAPGDLAEALRRGIIARDGATGGLPSFTDGIRQGNLRNIWTPLYEQLSVQLPSWSDALDALLEGQLDEATSREWFRKAGGDLDAFTWLYDTRGTSPTPDMLGTMANRQIIPWDGTGPNETTFAQGFLEGPWRNKWEEAMRKLQEYLPPPRTVTALLHEGSINDAEALTLFEHEGLTPTLAAAYVAGAHKTATAKTKALSATQIESLRSDGLINETDAEKMLGDLGYSGADAKLILTSADVKRITANTTSAVNRVRSLYAARKLQRGAAATSLGKLGLDAATASQLIGVWDIELAATVRQLTPAQIVDAWDHTIMDQSTAQNELEALGYTAYDAWVLLSIKNKGPLPGMPGSGQTVGID